jgi:hypothetical protein
MRAGTVPVVDVDRGTEPGAGPLPPLPPAAAFVELLPAGDGYLVGDRTLPETVAMVTREGPGVVTVTLSDPWPVFSRLVPLLPFPAPGKPWVTVDVKPLDARRLRVTRREGMGTGTHPADGEIRFTIHGLRPGRW